MQKGLFHEISELLTNIKPKELHCMEKQLFFSLDIGTRSVVAIAGEKVGNKINVVATERQEHTTRAMMDGQIHDVPLVSQTISAVCERLENKINCKVKKASVAAAGRSLVTITTTAEMDTGNILHLDFETEKTLELSAIQKAQQQLAQDNNATDPTGYYCVGYSVVSFSLDGSTLATLVGQRGQLAEVKLIATFLPRPVIDSMQAALAELDIEIGAITLEPIAAINLLVPSTMRHLNLALVDIGAGTSDIAITSDGSIIGFGMVPCAGDEITEALSNNYLLDFNVAEMIKRQLSEDVEQIEVADILGNKTLVNKNDLINKIKPEINNLAELVAQEILALNNNIAPQAVLLIGGGSLTTLLPKIIAETLKMPQERVAVRIPQPTATLEQIPQELLTPEAITPLGILCLVNSKHLNFITIKMNDQLHKLFNLGTLKVSDALLATGIDIKKLRGKPGHGIRLEVNGEVRYVPGTFGSNGFLELNNQEAKLDDKLQDGDQLKITIGQDGKPAKCTIADIFDCGSLGEFSVNSITYPLEQIILLNGKPASANTLLKDKDIVSISPPFSLRQALELAKIDFTEDYLTYTVNNTQIKYNTACQIVKNGQLSTLNAPIKPHDMIVIGDSYSPTLERLLELDSNFDINETIQVIFNSEPLIIDCVYKEFLVNDIKVDQTYIPNPNEKIVFNISKKYPIISDALLASNFDPQQFVKLSQNGRKTIDIILNGEKTDFISPIKDGDEITLIMG